MQSIDETKVDRFNKYNSIVAFANEFFFFHVAMIDKRLTEQCSQLIVANNFYRSYK